MINEQKVRLMTKLTIYEEKKGKRFFKVGEFFQGDYVGRQVLISFILGTIVFVIMAALYAAYNLEELMAELLTLDFASVITKIIIIYVIFMAIYLGITIVASLFTYKRAKRSLKSYDKGLKRLEKM